MMEKQRVRPSRSLESMKVSRERWLITGLVLIATVVRMYWASRPRVVWGDEPFYLWIGQSLLDGNGYQFFGFSGTHFAPLYPLLAASIARAFQLTGVAVSTSLELGSNVVYVVAGALLVLPIYGIAKRLTGTASALAAGLIVAFSPPLTVGVLLWGTMTEPLFLLFIASAWWSLIAALQEDRLSAYVLAGDALALAYLVRTEALIYLAAAVAAASLLRLTLGRTGHIGRTLTGVGLLLVAFSVLISPYLLAQYARTGKLQLTEEAGFAYTSMQGLVNGDTAVFDAATWGLDPASGEVRLFAPASEDANLVGAILADPRGFARLLRINVEELLAKMFSPQLIPWPLALLAFSGLFVRPWDRRRFEGESLLVASLAGPLSFVLFFVQERYLAAALIPAVIWMGAGAAVLGDWLSGSITDWRATSDERSTVSLTHHSSLGFLKAMPALILALALLWQQPRLWALMQQTNSFQPAHVAAASELQALGVTPSAVVLSRYPAIAFHAGTRWAPTPAASWPEVLRYARAHVASYLVIDEWETHLRPQLKYLLDAGAAPPELAHVATLQAGAASVVLYRFRADLSRDPVSRGLQP